MTRFTVVVNARERPTPYRIRYGSGPPWKTNLIRESECNSSLTKNLNAPERFTKFN